MNLFKSISFTIEHKEYDIRIFYTKTAINVVPFLKGYPANGYRYQVKIPKKCNAKKVLENSAVPELVATCQKDLKENNWQQLSKIILESKNKVHYVSN